MKRQINARHAEAAERAILLALSDDSHDARARKSITKSRIVRVWRAAKLVAKIFTPFISKLGQCCRDDGDAGRDAGRRAGSPQSEWKFDARRLNSHSGSMYRVCTACRIPPVFPTQRRACKSARTQVRIDGFVDTHLCRHLRYCGCHAASRASY